MDTAKKSRKSSLSTHAPTQAAGTVVKDVALRRVTTVRLPEALHQELEAIKQLDDSSLNHVFEEGMRYYVQARRDLLERQLDRALRAIRERPPSEEDFDAAIARLVRQEASFGMHDPAQGRLISGRQPVPEAAAGDLAARIRTLMSAG